PHACPGYLREALCRPTRPRSRYPALRSSPFNARSSQSEAPQRSCPMSPGRSLLRFHLLLRTTSTALTFFQLHASSYVQCNVPALRIAPLFLRDTHTRSCHRARRAPIRPAIGSDSHQHSISDLRAGPTTRGTGWPPRRTASSRAR
ncbi:hypothetical protein BD311DRAFT_44955, partial [Dichomitus squalens]